MANALVWSETIVLKNPRRVIRRWCFCVSAWNGVVMRDDGYASMEDAFRDAERLAFAATAVEDRGHKLKSWRHLLDEARLP